MSSKITIFLLSVFLLAATYSSEAQQQAKVPRIGVLCQGSCESLLYNVLWQGLRTITHIEATVFSLRSGPWKAGGKAF
jgi:hypothetical protein